MLNYIKNIKWVGALSLEDADILAYKALSAASVLEFGSGGSTLIFSQASVSNSKIISVETEDFWINEVNTRLSLVDAKNSPSIVSYKDFNFNGAFDIIFIDGKSNLREEFALNSWELLKPNGEMLFHDTKRSPYLDMMLSVVKVNILEISEVQLNIPASNGIHSNISVVKKSNKISPANNLQSIEQIREQWTFGGVIKDNYSIDKGLFEYKGIGS